MKDYKTKEFKVSTGNIKRPSHSINAITTETFQEIIKDSIQETGLILDGQGVKFNDFGRLNIEGYVVIEYAWATGCTVYIRNLDDFDHRPIITEDGTTLHKIKTEMEIGWAASQRTLEQSIMAVETYQKGIRLAAHISAKMKVYEFYYLTEKEEK
ncbi:MAG: hypothetical protein WC341_00450 [Bacteroidales bacterium]|jgi:hypothetical protein